MVISYFGSNFVSNDSILNIETNVENGARFRVITKKLCAFYEISREERHQGNSQLIP